MHERSYFTARSFSTPRVLLSRCLEVDACRYDGQRLHDAFVGQLLEFVEVVPVCPEVEVGLGVPRPPVRLVDDGGQTRLVQPATGRDLTESMQQFSRRFFAELGPLDGAILKSGSPSCGLGGVRVYAGGEKAPAVRTEAGLFARHILPLAGRLAVEDEGRLRNHPIRHHFLTRLYALAELREVSSRASMGALVEFHSRHKYLLLTYDEPRLRRLGRIAANPERRPVAQVFDDYGRVFCRALADMPTRASRVNAVEHIYGHFKGELGTEERHEFLEMLDEYRQSRLPLHALLGVLRTWCGRYRHEYLAAQSLLQPYPRELIQMRDSGKGIDF